MPEIDCIYIAASARDARFTRICVASVRYFYPDIAIKLLVGGPLQRGLADELQRHWNVGVAQLPAGDYGWGFVKLEPLFMPSKERFLVLDSDTVIAGPVEPARRRGPLTDAGCRITLNRPGDSPCSENSRRGYRREPRFQAEESGNEHRCNPANGLNGGRF